MNAKIVSSTIEIHASQLASTNLDTHNTYHTQHKEGPLLCYIVPHVALPSSSLQSGHRNVMTAQSLDIFSFTRFINQFHPLVSLLLQSTLGFFQFMGTWLPMMKLHFWVSKSGISNGFLGFWHSQFIPWVYIYGFPTGFYSSREFLRVFGTSKCGFFVSFYFCKFNC